MEPRKLSKVKLFCDEEGGLHLQMRGIGPQKVEMNWAPTEIDAEETARFLKAYRKLKGIDLGIAHEL